MGARRHPRRADRLEGACQGFGVVEERVVIEGAKDLISTPDLPIETRAVS